MNWVMIQNGIVVNYVIASDSDAKDPNYIWVNVTNYPQNYGYMPGMNWTTSDNINFTPPPGFTNG